MRRETGDASDRDRFEHMLRAARDALAIAQGRQRHELDHDVMLQHALVHCVLVVGEAAARVTDTGRTRVPQLPWPRMAGMRHILVHAYFKVDYDAIWRTITDHFPAMIVDLDQVLSAWPPPPE